MEASKIVLVEVEGGVATFVKVPSDVNVYLVDWDNVENGYCAFCDDPLPLPKEGVDKEMHSVCREKYEAIVEA